MTPLRPTKTKRSRPQRFAALFAVVVAAGAGSVNRAGAGAADTLDPAFLPALEALKQAVTAHEDDLAEGILTALLARGPEGRTLDLARSYERILTGRALLRRFDFHLLLEPVPAQREGDLPELRTLLVVRHDDEHDLELRLAPSSLRRVRTFIRAGTELGLEQSGAVTRTVHALDRLLVPAGGTVVLELDRFTAGASDALAVRDFVVLEPRAGHVLLAGVAYPAFGLEIPGAVSVRLAPWLPSAPVSPQELMRYVRQRSISLPPLIERAVRIPAERREEVLDLLTAALDELGENRLQAIVPALRWLARTSTPGGSPVAWRSWLLERQRSLAALDEERGRDEVPAESERDETPRPLLDLPHPDTAR